jgi:hypothetical protein
LNRAVFTAGAIRHPLADLTVMEPIEGAIDIARRGYRV